MTSGDQQELEAIRERYRRRESIEPQRYAPLSADVVLRVLERNRSMAELLRAAGHTTLAGLDVLEVGCGTGNNLLELLLLGAEPGRLAGNDLQPNRLALARERLPAATTLHCGDATALQLQDASLDIVVQFTVFSSILDATLQQRLAQAMWRWLKPGGAVLWYDFTYDNPRNRDVRGVPLRRIRELFPQARISARRVTLAPPLARQLCRVHPPLYTLANALPMLRTHALCWIAKPLPQAPR